MNHFLQIRNATNPLLVHYTGEDLIRRGGMTEGTLELRLESRAERFDEDQLLVADAQKDVEAAAGLYDKYYAEVFRYVYHSTLDHAVAEDLTANVFLSAFRHLGRFEWRRIPFRAWLYRIATNEIRMHYRRRRWASFTRFEPENGELPSEAPSAPECLAAREEYRLVHRALQELRLKYRTVIVLRYFEGKTIAEISDITRKREGTIKSQLHRGLAQLQEILGRWGVLPQ